MTNALYCYSLQAKSSYWSILYIEHSTILIGVVYRLALTAIACTGHDRCSVHAISVNRSMQWTHCYTICQLHYKDYLCVFQNEVYCLLHYTD